MPVTFGPDSHEAAVSDEEFEKIEQMIVARTHTSGPTRCNSLHKHPQRQSQVRVLQAGWLRQQPRHPQGYPGRDRPAAVFPEKEPRESKCLSKPIRMDELVKQVLERLLDTTLTEPTVRQLIEDVARDSGPYLEEGQARKKELSEQLTEVRKRIRNISEVIQTQGTQYQGLATLLKDLAELEEKERKLQEAIQEINDATEQARLFINDPDGIIEAILDLRTYTETRDEEAAKELISLFVTASTSTKKTSMKTTTAKITWKCTGPSRYSRKRPANTRTARSSSWQMARMTTKTTISVF